MLTEGWARRVWLVGLVRVQCWGTGAMFVALQSVEK